MNNSSTAVKVWDIPTRVFHWALVAVIVFQYASAEVFDDIMQLHFYGGYVCLALIMFRLVWGMIGSHYAQFRNFVVLPNRVVAYLVSSKNTSEPPHLGHNPAGGYAIVVMLSLILTQAISGLFITDDIFYDGPYYGVLNESWQGVMNSIHHNLFDFLLLVIGLHLLAIASYKVFKKQNLVSAMFTGTKQIPSVSEKNKRIRHISNHWIRFAIVVALVVLAVYLVVEVFPPEQSVDDWAY